MRVPPTFVIFAATAFVAAGASGAEHASVRRVAFVVGANDGGRERVHLRYAESDANNVAGVLERLGGVAPGDLYLLLGPDKPTFLAALEDLRDALVATQATSRRVELVVYYSGHSDEEGLLLKEERYPYRDFRHALETLPADVRIAILDSCASGAMTRRKGGTWKAPFMVDDSAQVQGHAILTSTGDDEAAQESDRLRASFFTHFLLTGLRGAADATHDGKVTLSEAYQFAYNETLSRTEATQYGAQHPAYDMQLSGTGDLVLTDLRQGTASLTLAPGLQGRVFVRDAKGRLAAELRKASGAPLDLGLEPGTYGITLLAGDEAFGARVTLEHGRKTALATSQLKSLPKEYAQARGGKLVDPFDTPLEKAPEPPAPPPAPPAGNDKVRLDIGVGSIEIDLKKLGAVGVRPTDGQPGSPGYTEFLFRLSLVPDLNTGALYADTKHLVHGGLNLVGKVDRVQGAELGLTNWVTEKLEGAQGALVLNWVTGDAAGAQGAGLFNVVEGNLKGVQVAGLFNVVANEPREGPFAGPIWALQGAPLFNVANGDLNGAQISAGVNVAGNLAGAQFALVNIAGDVSGAQVGLVNVAGLVRGTQVGLVNINEDVIGVPVGPVNVSTKGRFVLDAYWSDFAPLNLGMKFGSRYLFTELVLSGRGIGDAVESIDSKVGEWSPAMGLGFHVPGDGLWLDLDVLGRGRRVRGQDARRYDLDLIFTPRLQLGWNFFSRFSAFGGLGLNFEVAERTEVSALGPRHTLALDLSPSFFAGLEF